MEPPCRNGEERAHNVVVSVALSRICLKLNLLLMFLHGRGLLELDARKGEFPGKKIGYMHNSRDGDRLTSPPSKPQVNTIEVSEPPLCPLRPPAASPGRVHVQLVVLARSGLNKVERRCMWGIIFVSRARQTTVAE
jgi:hypothetical protein